MPKSRKISRKNLIKKLDIIFSKYIRLSNADKNGFCTCVTCGKQGRWNDGSIQAGHFMSRKCYSTRWDERNVNPQCVGCNIYKNGAEYKHSLFLGSTLSNELYLKSKKIVKFSDYEIKEMINLFQEKFDKLS